MDLRDFVKVYNLLTPSECDDAVKNHLAGEWLPHQWFNHVDEKMYTGSNDCHNNHFDETTSAKICDAVIQVSEEYLRSYNLVKMFSGLTIPRLNKYTSGQGMRRHRDHIHSIFDGNSRGIPIMSYVIKFNDDYEGGDLKFNYLDGTNENVELGVGDVVMWPSVFLYPHEVTPVTKGTRITAVMWGW